MKKLLLQVLGWGLIILAPGVGLLALGYESIFLLGNFGSISFLITIGLVILIAYIGSKINKYARTIK
jgi:hypothetical protein